MTQLPLFISSNIHKATHLNRLLGTKLEHHPLELDELQSIDPAAVIRHKAQQAYQTVRRPVLVDDVSMCFDALHGLPGPMIKLFVQAENGLENLCRMADGLASRRATARAYFGLYDGATMTIVYGEIRGEIADHPRGGQEFTYGWDTIFCPDGYGGRTRGELTQREYDTVYRAIRPIDQLQEILKGRS